MCSLFDADDHAGIQRFLEQAGAGHPQRMIFGRRQRPTSKISIVTGRHGQPELENAIWHLYLQKEGGEYRPHKKYWSINSNWRKLPQRPEYRHSRCLIPANAWVESQHGEHPVEFSFGLPFFFCGLYKVWEGGRLLSCSIITLPAHPMTERFHDKSLPMIAPPSSSFIRQWLSPDADTGQFAPYLQPRVEYAGRLLHYRPLKRATSTEYTGPEAPVDEAPDH
ncbi:SOS response-associated peptidase family protein [Microbulbifer yueqingensis]|uniref:Putative SOS response-associated peptidase YedK n=1 Tax=Microbulbifer yueqingensis TaxID=658219 RepID=A0A1G8UPK9_9GAMM|nr:SOS response-associated peptidase family protein [Microbulbifer yueqingensis]SDJ55407.1 Putative SOS response-associated peptidase YedK [Microbulbifer yueqingensis]